MTMEEMQAKMEIRELVDRFSSFETDVESQSKLFTPKVFSKEKTYHDLRVEQSRKRFSSLFGNRFFR